ncbi:alpha/beta hydrolase [Christensenellaceae bacterium OttesenSCG-928-K19]|nr:alpha/beta hydrolase [Christensenellaceae bacterium OttesenSCG-928-K19]
MLIAIIIVAVLLALLLVVWLLSKKVFEVAVKAKAPKEQVFKTNEYDRAGTDRTQAHKDKEWLASQPLLEHTVKSFDGLKLFGRVLFSVKPSRVWVVVCHGFSGNGLNMGTYARHFHEKGYNVFLPDLRACGKSEGDYMGMGWLDAKDMLVWISHILDMDKEAKIVLTGGSMGGATVMMTTGYDLPANVVAAIADCGYTSVWDEFTIQLKKVFGLPQFPFMHIADGMAQKHAGYSFCEASSPDQLKKSKTPTLFIHGTADEFVPYFMLDENYKACAAPKQKLSIEGAGHGVSAEVAPNLYWGSADKFLEQYL